MDFLIVVDMQNDFITGALGSSEATSIVSYVKGLVSTYVGELIFTRDTHASNYLQSREGQYLPVEHCIEGTEGWEICEELISFTEHSLVIDKPTFGSTKLIEVITDKIEKNGCNEADLTFTLVGLCTDICVISNAMLLKATFPESMIRIDSKGCAGVTPATHENALEAMKMCHIEVL